MTLTRFLRPVLCRAGIVAVAALLATGIGASAVNAQSGGNTPTSADGTPAKKLATKKSAAKPAAEKPQKPSQSGGSSAMQGFRPDPVSNY